MWKNLISIGFTVKLCSPIYRNRPAKTLVGVNPSTCINGGLTNAKIPIACNKWLHRCSWTVVIFLTLPSSSFTSSSWRRDSECRGACGRSPFAGGIPSMPHIAVVSPRRTTSHAYPPGLRTLYREIVAHIVDTSTSKKKSVVIIIPGIIAAKIHDTSSFQNSTMKWLLSGDVGRNDAARLLAYQYHIKVISRS